MKDMIWNFAFRCEILAERLFTTWKNGFLYVWNSSIYIFTPWLYGWGNFGMMLDVLMSAFSDGLVCLDQI